jgi:class 3 adenylate cyclase
MVNLGEVIIDGDDIFGDGVNIAARLEALARPGTICISHTVYDQVRNKLDLECRSAAIASRTSPSRSALTPWASRQRRLGRFPKKRRYARALSRHGQHRDPGTIAFGRSRFPRRD